MHVILLGKLKAHAFQPSKELHLDKILFILSRFFQYIILIQSLDLFDYYYVLLFLHSSLYFHTHKKYLKMTYDAA